MNQKKIVVIGDCIIDKCYNDGICSRISPEFPIPIYLTETDVCKLSPGGSANVAFQLKNFNIKTSLLGFIDEESKNLYQNYNFDIDFCVDLLNGNVPNKIRLYDKNFPILRWDIEKHNYGESAETITFMRDKLFHNLTQIRDIDVVILSDYAKGIFNYDLSQKIITFCNEQNIPTIVDPKKPPLNKWKNCTIFKPNSKEAKELTGLDTIDEQLENISSTLNCSTVITREGNGVAMWENARSDYKTCNFINDVNSTVGGGDCFIAVLGYCIANKYDLKTSCQWAFEAGAKYVQAKHNDPITLFDIKQRIDPIEAKIISIDDLIYLKENCKDENFIFTNGCFDFGLTSAHVRYLSKSKSLGGKLIVAINDDESVKRLKGDNRPIMSIQERSYIVASLKDVDFVVSFKEDTPLEIIKKIRPNIITKGGDYKKEDVVGNDISRVEIIQLFDGINTTEKIIRDSMEIGI